jgi:CRP/FNR family cyclic AMP-dependent transcriptional regulator
MTLKSRFEGKHDLLEALTRQKIIFGRTDISEAIAGCGELVEYVPGERLIEQGGTDRYMYFLLAGKTQVIVNGVRLYPREANVTVGEMSAINSQICRAATIEAVETTVAWKISHTALFETGKQHPDIWKSLAVELSGRLEQRNRFVNRANKRPRVFIICSAEALNVAKAIRTGLDHDNADVVLWSDDMVFSTGAYPLESLEEQVNLADFGIALAQPDDLLSSRGKSQVTARDNVIFELGFFMSRLGRARTLLLVPRGEDVKLPSDFKGLTPIDYNIAASRSDLPIALGPTIDRVSALIQKLGVRASLTETR